MQVYINDDLISKKITEIMVQETINELIKRTAQQIFQNMNKTIKDETQKNIRRLESIYDSNKFRDNVFFIVKDINVIEKKDAENFVLNYLKDTHEQTEWEIEKSSSWKTPLNIRDDRLGRPDLIAINKTNPKLTYFVEVKTNGDGIKKDQILWASRHPAHTVIYFFLNQKITSNFTNAKTNKGYEVNPNF